MESLLTDERLYCDTAGEPHFAHLKIGLSTRHFAPPAPPLGVSELTPVSRCGFLRMPAGSSSSTVKWNSKQAMANAGATPRATRCCSRTRQKKKDTAAGYSGPPTRFSRLSSCEL
jgi:hypothetical protein